MQYSPGSALRTNPGSPLHVSDSFWSAGRRSSHLGGIGRLILALGFVLPAPMPAQPHVADIMSRRLMCGFGFGFFQSPDNRAIVSSAPPERSGSAGAVQGTSRLVGQMIGAAAGGGTAARPHKRRGTMTYDDILYEKKDGVATVAINRPQRLNAFRAQTVEELIAAFHDAADDNSVGVIVLTGAGDRAFSSGGDNSAKEGTSGYGGRGRTGMPIAELHDAIRDAPKPVIAKVRGYAIGGGNVLATLCDLTICADNAQFGQVGPRVGSVDPGFGTAYLARAVGEKRAREIWFLCRRYSAAEAFQMGLVNKVVPAAELDAEVDAWCREILALSPTALAIAKRSFNADSENIRGIGAFGFEALALYYDTAEAHAGVDAFMQKRRPDFRKRRGG